MAVPRVLIVDDEPGVCFALQRLLESVGAMRAVVAHSADEAEAEIARGAVDAMVLDLHLPGMRGDAFFHRACEMQPSIAERTLFITGDPSSAARHALSGTGCQLMLKPFLASSFLGQLRHLTREGTARSYRIA